MAVLKIHSDIVNEERRVCNLMWTGIDGTSFDSVDSFIDSVDANDDTIELRINCRGGEVLEGWAIYDKLRATEKKITAIIEGNCASMASILLLAASSENRSGYQNASLLIHDPFCTLADVYGANELRQMAEDLEKRTTEIVNTYVERTGTDEEILRALMKEDKLIDMKKAKELGFISTIIPPLSASEKKPKQWNHSKTNYMNQTKKVSVAQSLVDKMLAKLGYAKIEDAEAGLNIVAIDLSTADGSTISIEREEGDPQVGDKASPDGEHVMPDGKTIVVVDGVITEIGESNEEVNSELEEANARIQQLEQEISTLRAQAKSKDELAILNKVKTLGGLEGLKKMSSNYNPKGRAFVDNTSAQTSEEAPVSFIDKKLAEKREANKNKFNK